jgi:hypothetical protein
LFTDVSGQRIGPIFKAQNSKKKSKPEALTTARKGKVRAMNGIQ